jgi:hypothetical protein
MDDLDDAIIEDTVHCCICGGSFVLGGNDGIVLDGAEVRLQPDCGSSMCIECAAMIHRLYEDYLREACVCEHGVADGDYCEPCNLEYKRARGAQHGRPEII